QMTLYGRRLSEAGKLGEIEALTVQIGVAEYAAQILGGIPMSQGETIRWHELGLTLQDREAFTTPAVSRLVQQGNSAEARARLITLIRATDGAETYGDCGLDETLDAMRAEMRRFVEAEVAPHAHEWHLKNAYIPLETIEK